MCKGVKKSGVLFLWNQSFGGKNWFKVFQQKWQNIKSKIIWPKMGIGNLQSVLTSFLSTHFRHTGNSHSNFCNLYTIKIGQYSTCIHKSTIRGGCIVQRHVQQWPDARKLLSKFHIPVTQILAALASTTRSAELAPGGALFLIWFRFNWSQLFGQVLWDILYWYVTISNWPCAIFLQRILFYECQFCMET